MGAYQDFSDESDGESYNISLSDFPMDGPDLSGDTKWSKTPSTDLFEFFPDDLPVKDMCAADDLFFHGRLLPSNHFPKKALVAPPLPLPACKSSRALLKPLQQLYAAADHAPSNVRRHLHRRSDSLNLLEGQSQLDAAADQASLRRVSSESTPRRPKWYMILFGSVPVPAAMEMREIRNRQRRRHHSPPSTPVAPASTGPWKLFRSISCKEAGIAAAAAPAPVNMVSRSAY